MNTKYPLLDLMMEDMKNQKDLYKPTAFWEEGLSLLVQELEQNNIDDFRKLMQTRSFFVPTYTPLDYLLDPSKYQSALATLFQIIPDKRFVTKLKRTFDGYNSAFSDYRVLQSSNIECHPHLDGVTESNVGNPEEQFEFNGRKFSRSFLNYLLGLSFLKQTVNTTSIQTVMEIGGGFGTLGEILLGDPRNNIFYINADIPPASFVSGYYLQTIFGKEAIADYSDLRDHDLLEIETLKKSYRAINLCSWQTPYLEGEIDLFVNFISFQEMEPDIVKNYCMHVDRLKPKFILLRNMMEGKAVQTPAWMAGVKVPVKGNDYDIFLENYQLLATDSEIYGFTTEDNFHSELRIYKRKDVTI
jgi:putative sugar O-methyltransferase